MLFGRKNKQDAPVVKVTKVLTPDEEVARFHAMIRQMDSFRAHDSIARTARQNDAAWGGRQAR